MDIDGFMENYKRAWETSDENLLASLFATDGSYRNTPFATQRGHEAIKQYWQRTKLQTDIKASPTKSCSATPAAASPTGTPRIR
jgi:hypothetical protein